MGHPVRSTGGRRGDTEEQRSEKEGEGKEDLWPPLAFAPPLAMTTMCATLTSGAATASHCPR